MRHLVLLLICALLVAGGAQAKPHKTHSSKAPGAKITMVHYGATW